MIRQPTVIEGECIIGENLDTGYFVVLRSCEIGNDVCIWSHCTVDPDARLGNRVKLHNHVYVSQGTVLEDDVFVGPGSAFLNDKYPPRYDKTQWQPPIVRRGAILGGGVLICPGVEIGERAIIGAGAVVTRDVPPGQVWLGIPARRVR